MFAKKDRLIANKEAMIHNRDVLIRKQQDRITELETLVRNIKVIASSNLYGTDGTPYLDKIKELVCDYQSIN